jgi:hypothetical protein
MKGNGETNIRVTARGGFVQRCAKIITYIPVLKNYIYSNYLEKIINKWIGPGAFNRVLYSLVVHFRL